MQKNNHQLAIWWLPFEKWTSDFGFFKMVAHCSVSLAAFIWRRAPKVQMKKRPSKGDVDVCTRRRLLAGGAVRWRGGPRSPAAGRRVAGAEGGEGARRPRGLRQGREPNEGRARQPGRSARPRSPRHPPSVRPSVRPDAPANEGCSRVAASGVRSKLAGLHPALRTLTSDYNTLKKQVHHFPAMLHDAIDDAKREVGATAQGGRHVTNLFAITRLGFAVQGSWIWFFFLSGFFFSVCFWGW